MKEIIINIAFYI